MTVWLVRPQHFELSRPYPDAPTVVADNIKEARLLAVLRHGPGMTVIHPLTLAVARQDETRWQRGRKRSPYVYAAEIREAVVERRQKKRRTKENAAYRPMIPAVCVVCHDAFQTMPSSPSNYCSEACRSRDKALVYQATRKARLPKQCACGSQLRTDKRGTVYSMCLECHGMRIRDAYERRQLQKEAA